jgi:hypothetical protein
MTNLLIDWSKRNRTVKAILLYLILAAVEALVNAIELMHIPADPKNIVILGFSLPRLMVFLVLLLAFLAAVFLTLLLIVRTDKLLRAVAWLMDRPQFYRWMVITSAALFLLGWIGCFTPSYRFGQQAAYFDRLYPLIVFITLFSAQTLLWMLVGRYGLHWQAFKQEIYQHKAMVRIAVLTIACGLLIWALAAWTQIGLAPDYFWGKAGVPLLKLQILLALAVGVAFLWLENRLWRKSTQVKPQAGWKVDLILFLLFWILAGVLWIRQPLPTSHFAPGPFPPNYEYYPYSDAAGYDSAAQAAMIGYGLEGYDGRPDKPLYSSFLVLLHLIMGQSYSRVIDLQVALLAIFPGIIYMIAKILFNRTAGIIAGVLAIFKGLNAIATTLLIWDVSHAKLMMSEMPMAVGLALFTLAMVVWLKQPGHQLVYLMAAGGILGALTLVRHNTWAVLPFALLCIFLIYRHQWTRWLLSGCLFCLVFFASIAPWMAQSAHTFGQPLYFLSPLRGTVWKNRFLPTINEQTNQLQNSTQSTQTPVYNGDVHDTPVPKSISTVNSHPIPSINPMLDKLFILAGPVATNFIHDVITSGLTLPTTITNDDMDHLVRKQDPSSYWNTIWDGRINTEEGLFIFFNLVIFAMGIGIAWQRYRLAGLMPLITFISYCLGTAVARTSGGRYIAPVDWVIYFYFAIGMLQLIFLGTAIFNAHFSWDKTEIENPVIIPNINAKTSLIWRWSSLWVVAVFLLLGSLVVLPDYSFSQRYADLTEDGIVKMLSQRGTIDNLGLDINELESFLTSENSMVVYGRALYPRFLDRNEDPNAKEIYSDLAKGTPFLIFRLIGPQGVAETMLPIASSPGTFPNGSDVVVLGCQGEDYLEAHRVVILSQPDILIQRDPQLPLACP